MQTQRLAATSSDAASSICASRSPTAATSAACTACRRRGCRGCRSPTFSRTRRSPTSCASSRRSGLRRLRITGGEPTIRPQIHELIRMLRAIPEIEDIALSTNGVRLPEIARAAARARARPREHERRQPARRIASRKIARRNLGFDPMRAALAAQAAGLDPIKLNMVVMRGINDDEIEDFARLTLEHPWHVRFIELMPVGDMRELTWEHVVPSDEILARLERDRAARRRRAGRRRGNGPAAYYQWPGARGNDRRDHADDAHVLRVVQSRAPHRRRPASHLPVRRSRGGSARRRCARASRSSRSSATRSPTSRRSTSCCR